jgi:hypothetical protein
LALLGAATWKPWEIPFALRFSGFVFSLVCLGILEFLNASNATAFKIVETARDLNKHN